MKRCRILEARNRHTQKLPNPAQTVQGSLLRRASHYRRGCPKCEGGGGHPLCVLTVAYGGGRTREFSLRPELLRTVHKNLARLTVAFLILAISIRFGYGACA